MLVAGAGTGGTITGLAAKIKEKCPSCKVNDQKKKVYFMRLIQKKKLIIIIIINHAYFILDCWC